MSDWQESCLQRERKFGYAAEWRNYVAPEAGSIPAHLPLFPGVNGIFVIFSDTGSLEPDPSGE
ncbi:hypothetical protein [Rhodophyticola porphyridii]|uniref:hypothetical protein n=1 Tax=Rhodophyticola porphyridii TaxID=1852017 RepID=UPI0011C364E0|nr:hypothetical protein [Rhodophyticola porphyridii]